MRGHRVAVLQGEGALTPLNALRARLAYYRRMLRGAKNAVQEALAQREVDRLRAEIKAMKGKSA